tara:strand:+ start:433 stop:1257 length:825 start_codon:yes stop_codon:yes gene_type:complete
MADEENTTTETQDSSGTESVLGSGVGENQDWRDSLSDELRNDPTLQNYKDVESLAKTVVHQQKMIGNRIPLPKTDEEKNELYSKLGRPEDATNYEVQVPETHQQYFRNETIDEFKNVAHKIGLNNEQVNALMDFQLGQIDNELQLQGSNLSVQKEEVEASLKKEWGFDYDKNLRAAQRALQVYGDDEVRALMDTEVGNNPAVIKLFARLGKDVTEDMAQNTQNNGLNVSPLDAKQEIQKIMDDPKHPYFDAGHRDHKAAVEQMRQLHEKVFGNR